MREERDFAPSSKHGVLGISSKIDPAYYSSMPRYTEKRLQELCERAIAAKDPSEVERITFEFRIALQEHFGAAKDSLGVRASPISHLDSITGISPPEKPKLKR